MTKITSKKFLIIYLFITNVAFAAHDDSNQYTIELNRIQNEIVVQDNVINSANNNILQAETQKTDATNILAAISCAPPLPNHNLATKLYQYVRDNHEWYFHQLGCDEGKLGNVCDDIAAKNQQQLEAFINSERHAARKATAQIALQNRLVEASYNKCQEMRNIVKQMDASIANANLNKNMAQINKQRLVQEYEHKQQELEQIKAQIAKIKQQQEQEQIAAALEQQADTIDNALYNTIL